VTQHESAEGALANGRTGTTYRAQLQSGIRRTRLLDPALAGIVVLAAFLRFFRIGAQSLWYDEFVTTDVINRPLRQVPRAVAEREGTPPLYYVLVWGWHRLFGSTDAAVRSFSALVGVALIPVVYAIVLQLGLSRRAARIAALLAAVNPMLVWYSQEARAYSLVAFLSALSVLFFVRSLSRGNTADVALWALTSAAATTTHYYALLLVAAEATWLLLAGSGPRRTRLYACVFVGIVGLALLPLALHQRSTQQQAWIRDWSLEFRAKEAGRHLLVGPAAPDGRLWVLATLLAVLAVVLIVLRGDAVERRGGIVGGVLTAAVVFVPLGAAIVGVDYFLDRNLIVALVPFTVLLAAGFGIRRSGWVGPTAALALSATFVVTVVEVSVQPVLQKADWRAVADVVDRDNDGAMVVVDEHRVLGLPLLRYLDGSRDLLPNDTVQTREIDVLSPRPPSALKHAPCSWWFGRACAFIFLGHPLPASLADRFTLEDVRVAGQFSVSRYVSPVPVSVTPASVVPRERVGDALVLWSARPG